MDVVNDYLCNNIALSINPSNGITDDSYITKVIYNEQEDIYEYIQQSSAGSDGFLYRTNGINWFGNKLFKNGNIYKLNEDLTLGNLLKENAYSMNNYVNKFDNIHDKYYYNSDSSKLY